MWEAGSNLSSRSVAADKSGFAPVEGTAGLVDRLPWLLGELHRSAGENTLQHRLGRLLEKLSPLLPGRPSASLDADRLGSVLPAISVALAQRRTLGGAINPWTMAGIKRREVRNAAVLAALWSRDQVGDVAVSFLAAFFARCAAPSGGELPTRVELTLGYRVRVENCPGADGADRVDLVIETATQLVGVEVKIDAAEGPAQLDRYVEAIRRSAGQMGKTASVVFLAPFGPSRNDMVLASWATVRDAADAVLPRSRSDYEFAHHLIAHFARHARSF